MDTAPRFAPTRQAALERLQAFLPKAGASYASGRNFDFGPGRPAAVSGLSPYLRHRLITEQEVLAAVLGRHSLKAAEKFVQEVFWRTYWKGWLQMRPSVWRMYRAGVSAAMNRVQTEAGMRRGWEEACSGTTGIDCFDAWARELVETGYLHNHARMWFASIWIFTLRLPWELGADFFLRHLLDGDPASNTLGWRWVAGVQTPGKNYLARASNIARYTEGRFNPAGQLDEAAAPLDGPPNPPRMDAPAGDRFDPATPAALLLTDDDLSPGWLLEQGLAPTATATYHAKARVSPQLPAPHLAEFAEGALADVTGRWSERLGPVQAAADLDGLEAFARSTGAAQIVTAFAPVGPVAETLDALEARLQGSGVRLVRVLRPLDAAAWPHATHGFFRFKEAIPKLVGQVKGLRAA